MRCCLALHLYINISILTVVTLAVIVGNASSSVSHLFFRNGSTSAAFESQISPLRSFGPSVAAQEPPDPPSKVKTSGCFSV